MRIKLTATAVATLIAIGFLAGGAWPAKSSSRGKGNLFQDSTQQSTKSSPEVDRLRFLVGDWKIDSVYPKSDLFLNGGEEHGTYSCHPGPGGFSLVANFIADGLEGHIEGLDVTTWDPQEKAYRMYTFGNGFAGAYESHGDWGGDNFVLTGDFAMGDTKFTFKQSTHQDSPDSLTLQEWFSQAGGQMQLMQTTKATRK
jgi:hypothetical protein